MMEHQHTGDEPLDYNYITDGIYIGTNQCCALGLSEVLKKEGISADISLEDIRLDQPFGVLMYVWIPTPDHTPPTQDQLVFGTQVIKELVRQKRKIYIHCKHGHGRTSTLVAAYFISLGKTVDEAIEIIKKSRPAIHLQEDQHHMLEVFASSWQSA